MSYNQCACGNRKGTQNVRCASCHRMHYPQPNTITPSQAAWLAGVFEGEGTFSVDGLAISMTDRDIIERLQTLTGVGGIYATNARSRSNRKPCWRWGVYNKPHRDWVLNMMWPWLGERRRQRVSELWADRPY
jgi:LAGLIDADG-like domain